MSKYRSNNRKSALPPTHSTRKDGTAILGRVIPELTITGVFNVTDAEALVIANSIANTILMHFQVDLLESAGLLGRSDEEF